VNTLRTVRDFVAVLRGRSGLIFQLVKREVLARYRGSVLGLAWIGLQPLLMLGLYTFAFAGIFKARWPGAENSGGMGYAIHLFAGLIVFNLFAEVASKAPSLVIQQANLVKKVVFPLPSLAWVGVLPSMVQLGLSYLIMVVVATAAGGAFEPTVLVFPVIILVFLPFLLGICWFLSAAGVYLRDLAQMMTFVVNLALFLSPIFYPSSNLPKALQPWMWLNPLSLMVEESRKVLVQGQWPAWGALGVYFVASLVFAFVGYAWFKRLSKGFADVV